MNIDHFCLRKLITILVHIRYLLYLWYLLIIEANSGHIGVTATVMLPKCQYFLFFRGKGKINVV